MTIEEQMRLIPHIVHLGTDLRGPRISPKGIQFDLAKAQADGFDPKDLYEKAVQAKELKGETKYPAPLYSEVDPSLLTPADHEAFRKNVERLRQETSQS